VALNRDRDDHGAMSTLTTRPYEVRAGDGERIWIVGDTLTFKATAETTGGSLTVLEVDAMPGAGPPPHVHTREDETFYVLDGTFEILLGDETVRAEPGDFAFVPRGTVHRFANTGDTPARMLITFSPSGMEGFFRAAGTPADGDGPAPPLDESEIARTDDVAERYGMRIVGWSERTARGSGR
jgi:quercetin dioxygenase-like cupin family protein